MISNILIIHHGIPIFHYDLNVNAKVDDPSSILTSGFIEALVNFSYEFSDVGLKDFAIGDNVYKLKKIGNYLISVQSTDEEYTQSDLILLNEIQDIIGNTKPLMSGSFQPEVEEKIIDSITSYLTHTQLTIQDKVYFGIIKFGVSMSIIYDYPNEIQGIDRLTLQKDLEKFINMEPDNIKPYGVMFLNSSQTLLVFFRLYIYDGTGLFLFLPLSYNLFEVSYFYFRELLALAKTLFDPLINNIFRANEWINTNRSSLNSFIIQWLIDIYSVINIKAPDVKVYNEEIFDSLYKSFANIMESLLSQQQVYLIIDNDRKKDLELIINYIFPGLHFNRPGAHLRIISTIEEGLEGKFFDINNPPQIRQMNYISENYLDQVPDINLFKLKEITDSLCIWFISKIYTYMLLSPLERLNIDSLFSIDDRLAIPTIVRALNNLKPWNKSSLSDDINVEVSIITRKNLRVVPKNKILDVDDQSFLLAYTSSIDKKIYKKNHSFILVLPSGRKSLTIVWNIKDETVFLTFIFETLIKLQNIIGHKHLIIEKAINYIKNEYNKLNSENSNKLLESLSVNIKKTFTLVNIDMEFYSMEVFLDVYNDKIPIILSELVRGRPIAITTDYELAKIIIDFFAFTTATFNVSKDYISDEPSRLTWVSPDFVSMYKDLGYLIIDLEKVKINSNFKLKYIERVWNEIQHENFLDQIYSIKNLFTMIGNTMEEILIKYANGDLDPATISDSMVPDEYELYKEYISYINPHILNSKIKEINEKKINW